jgi:hypothetical protein
MVVILVGVAMVIPIVVVIAAAPAAITETAIRCDDATSDGK